MARPTADELAAEIERQLHEAEEQRPTPDPLQAVGPPERQGGNALDRLLERLEAGPVEVREPTGLPYPDKDPEVALREALDSHFRRYVAEGYDQTEAMRRANEALRRQFPVTEDIPGTPTLAESTLLAIQPRIIRRDRRPISEAERLRRGLDPIVQGAAQGSGLLPRSAREKRDELIRDTIGFENLPFGTSDIGFETAAETLRLDEVMGWDDRFPTGPEIGLRAENQTLWALRVLGHGLVSAVQEFGLKWPVPDYRGAGSALWEKGWVQGDAIGALAGMQHELWGEGHTTLGEVLLGVTPEQRGQRIRRDGWVADWWQGVMEKVETGRGLETDLELGARARLSALGPHFAAAVLDSMLPVGVGASHMESLEGLSEEELAAKSQELWGKVGWRVGMALDIFVGWEKAPFTVSNAITASGRKALMVRNLLPGGWEGELGTVAKALASPEIEIAEYAGRRMGLQVEDGLLDPERIGPELQHFMDAVASNEHGMTWRELARLQGIEVSERAALGDSDILAARAAAEQVFSTSTDRSNAFRAAIMRPGMTSDEMAGAIGMDADSVEFEAVMRDLLAEGRVAVDDAGKITVRTGPPTDEEAAVRRELAVREMRADPDLEAARLARQSPGENVERPTPPEVNVESMSDFWDLLRGKAYRIPRHFGYERLKHLEPGAGPRTPEYVLRNGEGHTVETGTLQEMLDLILKRGVQHGEFGDDIWFRNHRIVARWRTPRGRATDRNPLAADFHFSSVVEDKLVSATAAKVPRGAKGPRKGPNIARRATHHAVADVVLQGPFRRAIDTRDLGPLGEVILDAVRLQARQWVPEGKMRPLGNGTWVAASDVARIHSRVDEIMEAHGLSERAIARRILQDGGELTLHEGIELTRLARRLGVDLEEVPIEGGLRQRNPQPRAKPGEKVTLQNSRRVHRLFREGHYRPAHARAVRNALIGEVGGVLADTRYRLRGSPMLVDRAQRGLAYAWANRQRMPAMVKAAAYFGLPFERSVIETLSPTGRQLLDTWTSRLGRVSTEIGEAMRRHADAARAKLPAGKLNPFVRLDPQQVLVDTVKDFAPVRPVEVSLAYRITGTGRTPPPVTQMDLTRLKELRQEVFGIIRRTVSYRAFRESGAYDWFDTSDPVEIMDGLLRWARTTNDDAASMASEYLISVASVVGRAGRSTDWSEALRALPESVLLDVWDGVFRRGELAGQSVRSAFTHAHLPDLPESRLPFAVLPRLEQGEAMFGYLVRERTNRLLAQALDELAEGGIVFRPIGQHDPRRNVLMSTLVGDNVMRVTRPDGTTLTRSRFPEAAQHWANQQLHTWGLRAGSRQPLDVIQGVKGGSFQIPRHLNEEISRALDLGSRDASAIFEGLAQRFGAAEAGRVVDHLVRMWKQWTLGVFIVPRMAYYVGQALGTIPILWTTRGLKGTADATRTFARHPLMVGELMQRVSAPDHWVFMSPMRGGRLFETADGVVYQVDELADAARAGGLGDTVFTVETMHGLRSMLLGMDTGFMDPRRLVRGAQWWTQYLQEAAGTFDQVGRISVYLDEVHKGTPLAEAAIRARKAMLDYRDLTTFDQRFMRMLFSFYAFMRKNADAYTRALFRHPERVLSQMRLQHQLAQNSNGILNMFAGDEHGHLTPAELGSLREEDIGRLIVYSSDEVVNDKGRVHPRYRMNWWVSTPLGAAEWMNTMLLFVDREWRPGVNMERMGRSVLPPWQSAMLVAAGQQVGADWKPDSFNANRIPPFLGRDPVVQWAFRVGPTPLRPGIDDLAAQDPAATAANGGIPSVWAAGRAKGLTTDEQEAAWLWWQHFRTWLSSPIAQAGQISRATGHTEPHENVTRAHEWLQLMGGVRVMGIEDERMVIARSRRQRAFELRESARRADPEQ